MHTMREKRKCRTTPHSGLARGGGAAAVLCLLVAGALLSAHGRPVADDLKLPYSNNVKNSLAELDEALDEAQAEYAREQPPPPAPATISPGLRDRFYDIFIRYGFLLNRMHDEFSNFAGRHPDFICTEDGPLQEARAKHVKLAEQWEAFGAMPLTTPEQKTAAALAAQTLAITTMLVVGGYVGLPLPCAFELMVHGQATPGAAGAPRGRRGTNP